MSWCIRKISRSALARRLSLFLLARLSLLRYAVRSSDARRRSDGHIETVMANLQVVYGFQADENRQADEGSQRITAIN
jgi:hypothetical protein